jgi:aerobic carbon-monoxide dehydrogenase small subunit
VRVPVSVTVNGERHELDVDSRQTLVGLLRDRLGLTGTHIGCLSGNCGACTIHLDGAPVKACCVLAAEADGHDVRTIESLAGRDGELHPLQRAFAEAQALQCGFCTPGMIMSALALLAETREPTEDQIRRALAGNLCRCTGYVSIFRAVAAAARSSNGRAG